MEQQVFEFFSQYAYEPLWVYSGIFFVMTLCAFGFPMPEEVIIVSAGIVGHTYLHPELFPPPAPGAVGCDPYTLAAACFLAVLSTDYIIYLLGKHFGKRLINSERFQKRLSMKKIDKVRSWVQKYGFWAPSAFRFIPGVRFPGHMMCGALDMKAKNFLFTDGLAALISVPTQVLLVSFYGKAILERLKQFKIIVFSVLVLLLAIYLVKRYLSSRSDKKAVS